LKIDVTALRRGVGREAEYHFREHLVPLELPGETVRFEPVDVSVKLVNAGDSISAYFSAKGGAHLVCSRCLREFLLPIETEFGVVYQQTAKSGAAREESGPNDIVQYDGDLINVSDDVRQQAILTLPMKPVCDASCKGLCPKCGADLNLGDCGCSQADVDARLVVLKDLFKKD